MRKSIITVLNNKYIIDYYIKINKGTKVFSYNFAWLKGILAKQNYMIKYFISY
jgi:hypothetical protein